MWVRFHGLLLPPGADRSRDSTLRAVWRSAFRRRKSEPRSARGSWQPLGHRSLWADWATGRLSAGLRGPEGVLGPRRRYHSLAWPRSLRCRWRATDLASLCCSAIGSAGWSPSSLDTRWSPTVSMVLSATPAIWGCLSTRWGGASPFVRGLACCSRRSLYRLSSRASVRKRGCCVRSLAANTIPSAPAPRG